MSEHHHTQPLNALHREQVDVLLRAGGEHTRLLLSGATILTVSTLTVVLALWQWDMAPSTASLALAAVLPAGVAVLLFARWRQHQARLWRPLRAALEAGTLHVTRGVLNQVRPAIDGGLHYVVNGMPLHLYPVATENPLNPLLPGRRLDRHAHIATGTIELHWLAIGTEGAGVLLDARHPDVPAPRLEQAPANESDNQRALWRMRDLLWMLSVVPVAMLVPGLLRGSGHTGGIELGLLAVLVAVLLILALGFAWKIRQRRHPGQLHTLRGVITERFSVRQSWGDSSHHLHWYRVGSTLFCPGAALQKEMTVGERAQVEQLKVANSSEPTVLVSFGPDPG